MTREQKVFAVCDLDEQYVVRLTGYLNEKKSTPFRILAFTRPEHLIRYADEHPIEILLISREAMCDEVKSLNISRTLILSDDSTIPDPTRNASDDSLCISRGSSDPDASGTRIPGPEALSGTSGSEYPTIRKYQSSGNLVRDVMRCYSGEDLPSADSLRGSGTSVYAVYSPISRCGKTLFSLTLAEILAERKRTLYLNLESYSGFEALFGCTYRTDLTDLVCLFRRNDETLPIRFESSVQTLRNADYIPPAFFPADLKEISGQEWIPFLASLSGCMNYQAIVLDIGTELSGVTALLAAADHIYMPLLPDPLSRAKVSQYEKDMESLSMESVMERTVRLYLPEVRPRSGGAKLTQQLVSGELGTYTRRLLSEETGQKKDRASLPGPASA